MASEAAHMALEALAQMIAALFLWLAVIGPVDVSDLRIIDESPAQPVGPMILIWELAERSRWEV